MKEKKKLQIKEVRSIVAKRGRGSTGMNLKKLHFNLAKFKMIHLQF